MLQDFRTPRRREGDSSSREIFLVWLGAQLRFTNRMPLHIPQEADLSVRDRPGAQPSAKLQRTNKLVTA
jgi:hypothetical protein